MRMHVMRWPLALLTALLSGLLLVPLAFPVAADGEGGEGDGPDDQDGRGDREDEQERESEGKDEEKEDKDDQRRDEGRKGDEGDDERDEDDDEKREGNDDGDRGERRKEKDGKERKGDGKGAGDDEGDGRRGGPHGDENPDPRAEDDGPATPVAGAPLGDAAAPRADVRVSQDYDVAPGLVTFTFTVTNHGDAEARGVQLSGALPDVGSWVILDPACELGRDGVECAIGDLGRGDVVEVQARSALVGDLPAFTNVVQVYTPPRPADEPASASP